jgi:3-phosphoshikimate 1-carboxyvinyltransferase
VTRFPEGIVRIPPSKSVLHRAIICAALAGGWIGVNSASDDVDATARCVSALMSGDNVTLDCGESGSTLRFLIPVALALGKSATFTGRGRLLERPMEPFFGALRAHGAEIAQTADAIEVSGELSAGIYELPGDVSSQFVTGLLFALPLLRGDSEIRLTTALESAGYVELTLDELGKSGVEARRTGGGFEVPGGQRYLPREMDAEGDWSQAAFFLAARALGRDVEVAGLDYESKQGDREIAEILRRATADGGRIRAIDVDASGIPDIVPPVTALLCFADGVSRIYNAGRLRHKESDRLAALAEELGKLGAEIAVEGDALVIRGVTEICGGTMSARGDHRIAMAGAVAAIRARGAVTIEGAECVSKSYPDFWKDFEVSGK